MSAYNILRLWTDALTAGEKLDLASGDTLALKPVVDDQGAVNVGDGTNDMDFKIFVGASTDYFDFNVGNGRLDVAGAEIRFATSNKLEFRDSAVYIQSAADANLSLVSDSIIQLAGITTEKMTQTALTNTATVTAAQLLTKVLDGTPTAAATYTLPTAALLVGGIAGAKVGDSFLFVINNKSTGAYTITVAAGSGGTADGTLTVAQNVIRPFLVIITNVTASSEAYYVYGLGS